jgi:hypothetical protein
MHIGRRRLMLKSSILIWVIIWGEIGSTKFLDHNLDFIQLKTVNQPDISGKAHGLGLVL